MYMYMYLTCFVQTICFRDTTLVYKIRYSTATPWTAREKRGLRVDRSDCQIYDSYQYTCTCAGAVCSLREL